MMKFLLSHRGYGATHLCKTFPDRHLNVDGVKTLIKNIDMKVSHSAIVPIAIVYSSLLKNA